MKQAVCELRGHAAPVVLHGDGDGAVPDPGVHGELPGRLDGPQRVDRVRQQVDHYLLEPDGVAVHGWEARVEPPAHGDFVHAEPVRHEVQSPADDVVQVDGPNLPLRRANESQQPAQQLGRSLRLTQHLLHLVAMLGGDRGIGEPVLGVRRDGHERVVHLMGYPGE